MDDDNGLQHVFWSDTVARNNYNYFGDIFVFDTTYETNRYRIIFVPFTRVNIHRQSVTFVAVLLNNERVESFIWFCSKFLEAMGRQDPNAIITDEDLAMTIATKQVLEKSIRRFLYVAYSEKGIRFQS